VWWNRLFQELYKNALRFYKAPEINNKDQSKKYKGGIAFGDTFFEPCSLSFEHCPLTTGYKKRDRNSIPFFMQSLLRSLVKKSTENF
jgi:hypothetical protein